MPSLSNNQTRNKKEVKKMTYSGEKEIFCCRCRGLIAPTEVKRFSPIGIWHSNCFAKEYPHIVLTERQLFALRRLSADNLHERKCKKIIRTTNEGLDIINQNYCRDHFVKSMQNIIKNILSLMNGLTSHLRKQINNILAKINSIFKNYFGRNLPLALNA